jgi:hypothetical protein
MDADTTPQTFKSQILARRAAARIGAPRVVIEADDGYVVAGVAPTLEERAHEAATSPHNDRQEPTEGQKKAGNYKLGRVRIAGMDICIENPEGSTRRGTAPDGTPWETTMGSHYGYFGQSKAKDGDHVDVFIKPGTPEDFSGQVFVVDQIEPETGKYDEAKAMLGYASEEEARDAYLANYDDDWQGLGAISAVPLPAFRAWVKSSEAKRPLGTLKDTPEDGDGLGQPADAGRPAGAEPPDPGAGAGTGAVVPGELPSESADRVAV